MNRRAQAKLETRDRVLDAAKRLFIARGYEAATIRDIAAEAGMSTGAVFANFTDKKDLFNQVMSAEFEAQAAMVQDLSTESGTAEDVISRLFAIGYGIQSEQLALLRAQTVLSWSEGLGGEFGDRPQSKIAKDLVVAVVQAAAKRGELKPKADVGLLAEMIWDAYCANYRRALFADWTAQQLSDRLAEQTRVILGLD